MSFKLLKNKSLTISIYISEQLTLEMHEFPLIKFWLRIRDAHGPGQAELSTPASRTGRKRAEILPKRKQPLHEKAKISCKFIIKFTFHKDNF